MSARVKVSITSPLSHDTRHVCGGGAVYNYSYEPTIVHCAADRETEMRTFLVFAIIWAIVAASG